MHGRRSSSLMSVKSIAWFFFAASTSCLLSCLRSSSATFSACSFSSSAGTWCFSASPPWTGWALLQLMRSVMHVASWLKLKSGIDGTPSCSHEYLSPASLMGSSWFPSCMPTPHLWSSSTHLMGCTCMPLNHFWWLPPPPNWFSHSWPPCSLGWILLLWCWIPSQCLPPSCNASSSHPTLPWNCA